jgi:hypothetical protein
LGSDGEVDPPAELLPLRHSSPPSSLPTGRDDKSYSGIRRELCAGRGRLTGNEALLYSPRRQSSSSARPTPIPSQRGDGRHQAEPADLRDEARRLDDSFERKVERLA